VNSQAELIRAQSSAADDRALATPQVAFKIETIRVQPQKLDSLMTLAAELTVTTTRVVHGLSTHEEIVDLWEEWNKDVAANDTAHDATETGARGANTRLGAARRTAAF
jgi:two-component system chemotaxis sensor kinase CheA